MFGTRNKVKFCQARVIVNIILEGKTKLEHVERKVGKYSTSKKFVEGPEGQPLIDGLRHTYLCSNELLL